VIWPWRFNRALPKKALTAVAVLASLISMGCGRGEVVSPSAGDSSKLRGIARVYAMAARDLGRPPANVEELKSILAPVMDDPASMFRSSRDGEDFVIVWGRDLAGKDFNTVQILAYERQGAGGTRMILDCRGEVHEVEDEDWEEVKEVFGLKQS
jgi:hypothetical protein